VTNYKIIDEKIKHPVEHHISSTTSGIPEQLLRHPLAKRRIEKVNYFGDYLCKFIHIGCKITTFLVNMQIFCAFSCIIQKKAVLLQPQKV
jgi:hypothetical protein